MLSTRATLATLILAAGAMPLLAQDSTVKASPKAASKWEFTIAPYVLFPTMQGTNAIGNFPAVSVNASASDIFSHLQGGAMLYFGMKKGDWAFATDVIYMKLGQDINPDSGFVSGSLTMKQAAWEAFVFYQFVPTLEVGLGGLGVKIDADATVKLRPSATPAERSLSETWGLPVLAMRWTPWSTEHWTGLLFADFGGTGGNNWSYQVMPSVGYKFGKTFELTLQYRYIALDYQTGSGADNFAYRMNIYGPQIGFGFHF